MGIEKVIKGLECHQIDNNHRINCADCPYYVNDDNYIRCVNDLHDDAIALLKEQEIGHWIFLTDCSNSGVYCSECNTKVFDSYPFKKKFSYFCPHCGTRMESKIERL